MSLALIHQYDQARQFFFAPANDDAPTPWRAVYSYSELAAILDANGFSVTICRREIAERIVAAVNGAES